MEGYLHKAKVNVKSLAAEARIVRMEERRTSGETRRQLYLHRVGRVREEARAAQLAYGFLRGRLLITMERSNKQPPVDRIREKVAVWTSGLLPYKERERLLGEVLPWLQGKAVLRSTWEHNQTQGCQ